MIFELKSNGALWNGTILFQSCDNDYIVAYCHCCLLFLLRLLLIAKYVSNLANEILIIAASSLYHQVFSPFLHEFVFPFPKHIPPIQWSTVFQRSNIRGVYLHQPTRRWEVGWITGDLQRLGCKANPEIRTNQTPEPRIEKGRWNPCWALKKTCKHVVKVGTSTQKLPGHLKDLVLLFLWGVVVQLQERHWELLNIVLDKFKYGDS